jgi:chemotaxis protein CheC
MDRIAPFTELEIDAIKELMNTGVGRSARALSELFNRQVRLSVPRVSVLDAEKRAAFVNAEFAQGKRYAMARQGFMGLFEGQGIFILPYDECLAMAGMIGLSQDMTESMVPDIIEELSNLVLVSCVGFIASSLGRKCTFTTPEYQKDRESCADGCEGMLETDMLSLGLRTTLLFKDSDADAHLILTMSGASLPWLKEALGAYIEELRCSTISG